MKLKVQHDMWTNGLCRAEWDLTLLPYYPAYQHTPGMTYCEHVLPIFPTWGQFFFPKIDLDLAVVLTWEQFCPQGTLGNV